MTYNATYYEKNRERVLDVNKKWREANPEMVKEIHRRWKEANEGHTYETPEGYVKYIGYQHPATTKSGITSYHRIVLWDKLDGQDAPCNWCGKELSWSKKFPEDGALIADHVNTVKNDNRPENIVPSCHKCNVSREGGQHRNPTKTQIGECDFEGCDRDKVSKGLCGTHFNQMWAGKELTPIKPYKRASVITDTEKECTSCEEVKPHSDFYIRNGKPKGVCKKCEIQRTIASKQRRLARNIPCSEEGCTDAVLNKGLCQTHYHRQWEATRNSVKETNNQ